ncbi:MAG: ferritin family protein [Deltaproteobacteria bacterium]|nr:ferritin family protein [Deltaproteobacteria bacterium]
MTFEHLEEKEAVKRAALIEVNGHRFYSLLAERTESGRAKTVFHKLAEDEKKHLKIIEGKYFTEAGFGEQVTDEEIVIEDYLHSIGADNIFTKRINVEELLRVVDTTKKALTVALASERHSVRYFEDLSKRSKTPEGRSMYNALADEERSHVSEIEALLTLEA